MCCQIGLAVASLEPMFAAEVTRQFFWPAGNLELKILFEAPEAATSFGTKVLVKMRLDGKNADITKTEEKRI